MNRTCAVCAVVCMLALAGAAPASAGSPDYESIADTLVNQLAEVQPGEVVVIQGTLDQQPLLEALVVATWIAGGQPTVEMQFPKANKRALMEMPMEHMKYPQWYGLAQSRLVDCYINVASVEDPMLFADVPEERFEAVRESGKPLQVAFQQSRFRAVNLGQTGGVPTAAYAESQNAEFGAMTKMFWKAVDTDYKKLRKHAKSVASALASGETVRVTTGAGTDISFAVADVAPRINCGRPDDNLVAFGPMMSWLPAGEAYAPVRARSANGRLVVPYIEFRGIGMKDVEVTFEDGMLTGLSSSSDLTILETYLDSTDDETKMLSVVDVGVNSDSHQLEGSDFASWEMGGMVTLATGNNIWSGGDNMAAGALTFHLPGATLLVGDATVCENGKLTPPG